MEQPPEKTPEEGTTEEQQGGGGLAVRHKKRTFKIKTGEDEYRSRITGHTPKQAASKALTLIVNDAKASGKTVKGKVCFTIRETTRGSRGKEYCYQGEKVKLAEPTRYSIRSSTGGVKEIVNRYKNVIEKYHPSSP